MIFFKDARSVSLYPYNQLQILQIIKNTNKINIAKGFAKLCDKQCIYGQKIKTKQQQNKEKSNIKALAGARN